MVAILGDYQIKKGLSDQQISQLIEYASSDEGLKYTSDPKRFKDRASFDEFSKEILAYYTLVDNGDNLLGIIWFHDFAHVAASQNGGKPDDVIVSEQSERRNPDLNQDHDIANAPRDDKVYGISFAIRLYGEARGKGLSEGFTEKVMADFKNSDEYKNHPHKGIWLSVSPENEPAVKLYRKLGFKDLEINKKYNKLLMVL